MKRERFIEKCEKTHKEKYNYDKVPIEFKTSEKPYFEIGCKKCGSYWNVRYDQFQAGSGCPKCTKTGRKKYPEEQLQKLKDKYPNLNFSNSIYLGADKEITFICNKHGKQTSLFYNLLNRGKNGCSICDLDEQKTTKEEFILQCKEIYNEKYDYSLIDSEFVVAGDFVNIKCNSCKNIFVREKRSFLHGYECDCYLDGIKTNAHKHITEKRMFSFLKEKGFSPEREKVFKDLKFKNKLRIDIFLKKQNIAIEIQGPHHYKPYKYSKISDEKAIFLFEEQKIKDNLKREWCKNNNIKFIEIPLENINTPKKILEWFNNNKSILK